MEIIIGFAVDIWFAILKNTGKKVAEKITLKKKLKDFLKNQSKLKKLEGKSKEINFDDLQKYIIKSGGIDDIEKRIFGDDNERKEARDNIKFKAREYAMNNGLTSEKVVIELMLNVGDSLRSFYFKKLPKEDKFIINEVKECRDDIVERLDNLNKEEKCIKNIKDGNIKEAEQYIGSIIENCGKNHTLYPYYGFRCNSDNKLYSFPISEDAEIIYPRNLVVTTTSIKIGDEEVKDFQKNIFSEAYKRQARITMKVEVAEQYLGKIKDPVQSFAETLSGRELVLEPPAFRNPLPCYIDVDGERVPPYLVLKAKEIIDDNIVVFSNCEENDSPFELKLMINLEKNMAKFEVKVKSKNNKNMLEEKRFLSKLKNGKLATLKLCESEKHILSCNIDNLQFDQNIEAQLELFERIVKIENYFKREIVTPMEILKKDFDTICLLSELIDGGVTGTWEDVEVIFIVSAEFKQSIKEMKVEELMFKNTEWNEYSIFGETFNVPVSTFIYPATISDLERLKNRVNYYEDGDTMKVKFISCKEDAEYYQRIENDSPNNGVKLIT